MGAFLNRFGVRVTTILACLSCAIALGLGSIAPSVTILYIAFSVPFALGQSIIFVSTASIATIYFDKRRSVAFGLMTSGHGLGTLILGPTLQALVDAFGWRNTFRLFAGIMTLFALSGFFLHQRPLPPTVDDNKKTPSKKFRLNLSLLKNTTFLVLVITAGAFTFSRQVPYVHLVSRYIYNWFAQGGSI